MPTIVPNLWFDGQAEQAAEFYTSIFPDSRIGTVHRAASDYPGGGRKGDVVAVDFRLSGQPFTGINGGPQFTFDEAISFLIDCEGQAEVDRYWDALIEGGGEPGQCGWLKDRFGVSWQVVPRRIEELLDGDDRAGADRAMEAVLRMSKLVVAEVEAAYQGAAPRSR